MDDILILFSFLSFTLCSFNVPFIFNLKYNRMFCLFLFHFLLFYATYYYNSHFIFISLIFFGRLCITTQYFSSFLISLNSISVELEMAWECVKYQNRYTYMYELQTLHSINRCACCFKSIHSLFVNSNGTFILLHAFSFAFVTAHLFPSCNYIYKGCNLYSISSTKSALAIYVLK